MITWVLAYVAIGAIIMRALASYHDRSSYQHWPKPTTVEWLVGILFWPLIAIIILVDIVKIVFGRDS